MGRESDWGWKHFLTPAAGRRLSIRLAGWRGILPYLPILTGPFILLSPVFLSGKALFWGTPLLQFGPWWSAAWAAARSGDVPLWNSQLGMGAPLLANYQSALFYPPTWIYGLLFVTGGAPAMAWGMALVAAAHLAWAGLGMGLLARRTGLSPLAQTISGLAFGLSGYLVARAGFLSINAAASWLPWVLLAGLHLAQRLRTAPVPWTAPLRPALGLSVVLTMQLLAGHAQTTWYTLLLAAAWVVFWTLDRSPQGLGKASFSAWFRVIPWFSLSVMLAVLVAAIQLLPTIEYLAQSHRIEAVDYALAMTYSFWPWRLLTLLAPNLFGSPALGNYWGYANFWEDALYLGLLPLLMAAAAMLRRKKPQRALVAFLSGVVLVSFLLALGKNTPLFPFLYQYIPTFDMFQAPARYLLWAQFALAMLAGIGVQGWRRPSRRALYWSRLGTAGAFAVMIAAGIASLAMGQVSPTFITATALAGLCGVLAGILHLLAPPKMEPGDDQDQSGSFISDFPGPTRATNLWSLAVILFVTVDLLAAGWGLNPGESPELYQPGSPAGEAVSAQLQPGERVYLPTQLEQVLKFKRFFRFSSFDPQEDWRQVRSVLLPNLTLLEGIPSANNFDPLLTGRYNRWIDGLESADPAFQMQLYDLMGVSLVEMKGKAQPSGVRFKPVVTAGRWRWVPCALVVPDPEASYTAVFSGEVNFSQHVILEGRLPPSLSECLPETGGAGIVHFIEESSNNLDLRLESSADGWLLLSDTAYPGWIVTIDDEPAELFQADYLFRAVWVPAGIHTVRFFYRPFSFWLGAGISLIALISGVSLYRCSRPKDP